MTFAFDPHHQLVLVWAEIEGPSGTIIGQLVLDTGASRTVIHTRILTAIGYDPAQATQHLQAVTGSGVEVIPLIVVRKIFALGHEYFDFPVLCHALPPSSSVDGLLGLDYLRGKTLTVDFRNAQITLG